jgi:hypothetical protein
MHPLLLAALLLQEPQPVPAEPAPHQCPCVPIYSAELRAGGWWMGSFDALTPAGRRQIDSSLFFDAGIDLEVERYRWTLTLSGDYGVASDVTVAAASLRVGRRFMLGSGDAPLDLQISAGPIFGKLDVNLNGFGDFKSGIGGEARADLKLPLHERLTLDFWLAYRQLSFKYDEPMISGDSKAGGATAAVGLGLLLRF